MTITTEVMIPEAFSGLFDPHRYKIYYGGRDGAKSYTFAQALLIKGIEKRMKFLCVREYQSSIKDSVKSTIEFMIEYMGLQDLYKSTDRAITGVNGTVFIFAGIKLNISNIKSINDVDIVWVEESNTVSTNSWEVLLPTIRKEDSEIWCSFNPYLESDPVWDLFVLNERPDSIIKKVTFRDNPFSSTQSKAERAYDKEHDIAKYLHKWEGEFLKISDAVIFKDKFKIDYFETPSNSVFYLGLDFGFSSDPLAFIRCYLDQDKRLLFIDRAASSVGVEIEDTPTFLTGLIPKCKGWLITADNARPEIISYLSKQGFRIVGSKKGKDSIVEGIEFIKNYTTIIHPSLKDVIYEFSNYSYKVEKLTGVVTPLIQDKDNHFIDALRYSLERVRKPKFTCSIA